jgi:hypothetical protein
MVFPNILYILSVSHHKFFLNPDVQVFKECPMNLDNLKNSLKFDSWVPTERTVKLDVRTFVNV